MHKTYDTFHMGRSGIDLYANDVGSRFVEIKSFAAYVGGSPTNISVGTRRLGLKSALLTAVGEDPVGDFVLHFLQAEGVETRFIPRKPGHVTSAVLLGIEPPDRFPLVFYRDNCADVQLSVDDVLAAPLADCRVLQFAGTNLSKEPVRSATLYAVETARAAGAEVVLDLDLRVSQWHDPRAFGAAIRSALRLVDVAIGTRDEINAAVLTDPAQIRLTHSQHSDARVEGDVEAAIEALLRLGPRALVEKRGSEGVRVHLAGETVISVPGFPVEVYNILGAGDAFAAGFLYGRVRGWDWYRAARLGNACGAIVVTKHCCANFMPTLHEVESFIAERGG
ncbi:MAG TPA: 5-dehydro-2-deoxygluconokinase, partial [Ardenticatenaceae bacterium]|nr:5-dehydro-2-deoxygluconokinase [Ardenticatenaceae bacterium]